jgi:pyrroloquinoline quinone (PQQ) biosynthesis protein C
MSTPHLRTLEPHQGLLFEQIVKRVAAENDVPVTAAGGVEVLQEIGFAVGAMLSGRSRIMTNLSPEIDAMVEVWRKLEREARSAHRSAGWRSQPVSMLAAC